MISKLLLSTRMIWMIFKKILKDKIQIRSILNKYYRAPTSTQLHPPPPSSTQLYPPPPSLFQPRLSSIHLHMALFSLHSALCNTLNNISTRILPVIGQFPQIQAEKIKLFILAENWHTWYIGGVDSKSKLRFLKF